MLMTFVLIVHEKIQKRTPKKQKREEMTKRVESSFIGKEQTMIQKEKKKLSSS